jgi:hypothetical protein
MAAHRERLRFVLLTVVVTVALTGCIPLSATGSFRTGLTKAHLVSLNGLSDLHLWLGTAHPEAPGVSLDVQAELQKNGTTVETALRRCVGGLANDAAQATNVAVSWSQFTKVLLDVGDVLSLKISTRIGTHIDGSQCDTSDSASGLRVFYGSASRASEFVAAITPDSSIVALRNNACGADASCDTDACAPSGPTAVTLSLLDDAPTAVNPSCQDSGPVHFADGNQWATVGTWNLAAQCDCGNQFIPEVRNNPPAPAPEPITVTEVPLPPTAPSSDVGSCTTLVNPNGTGCIDSGPNAMQSGGYIDNNDVTATINFSGGPAAPDPASIYSGSQLIVVKTDGTTFSNGDAWKCLTCAISAANQQGASTAHDYPQPFHDGKRVLWGNNIVECTDLLVSDACTPSETHVYPIFWNGVNGSTNIRELRLHPDNVHIGFNHIVLSPVLGQWGYLGRLQFDASPTTGTPLVPRYDIINTTGLYDNTPDKQPLYPDPTHPSQLVFNPSARAIGELRGFTKDGKEVVYIGNSVDSDNIDVFAADLTTGAVRRLTSNPEYTDPVDVSPDSNWMIAMDTRGSNRQEFMAAMNGIPPLTDQVSTAVVASVRNNGVRRFFEPYLIDRYGDRGSYQGQQINAGNGSPGSVSDPNWNGMADPRWSPDGTSAVYWQALVTSPACGGVNPLPCPASTEPGARRVRMMIARFTSRAPLSLPAIAPVSDTVPWGTVIDPGVPNPLRYHVPAGHYTLKGKVLGSANVQITENAGKTAVASVSASYTNYSDDGIDIINGTESVSGHSSGLTGQVLQWDSNLALSGCHTGTKVTSEPGGFNLSIDVSTNIFEATGTLTTTVDGQVYNQPANGT